MLVCLVSTRSVDIAFAQENSNFTPESSPVATPIAPPVNPINLTVSPVNINLETDPGNPVTTTIKILNNGLEAEYLELDLQKFTADKIGSKPIITEFSPTDDYQNWISFDQNKFNVNPGEWKTIKVEFSPPNSAALSYYYAILVKRQVIPNEEATTLVSGVPAILVLTNVRSPHAKFELQLEKFTSNQKIYEFLPTEFEIVIKNQGNVHIAPLGNIFIDRGGTKDLATLSLNKENGLILPESERTFKVTWDDGFPVYENQKLKWDFTQINKFRFGRYSAHLLFIYDDGERDIPIESKLTFWVIPWRIIFTILIITILASLGVILPVTLILRKIKKQK